MNSKADEDRIIILFEWKKLYTEAAIDALKPKGDVLEIGFSKGIGAECIQKYKPKSHLIVEPNPKVFEEAKKWAEHKPKTTAIQGTLETILPTLGKFDTIFLNDYPSIEHDITLMNFLFPELLLQLSTDAKKVLSSLEEQMTTLTNKFSDKDVDNFYQKTGQFNVKDLPKFFQKLKDNGNITQSQYKKALKKYKISSEQQQQPQQPQQPDPILLILGECLKNHMVHGSRFSIFLYSQTSKYDDSQFFERIITNPEIDYKEITVPIKGSDKTREALILLVEKLT